MPHDPSNDNKAGFQKSMSEILVMVDACRSREQADYMYRNMMQACHKLSKEHNLGLETSDVRRRRDRNLIERRKIVA